ncbi:MAG: JAB domain-containing protein [Candidatus Rokubacteria bacterium]|nr:JAB domain-containing protein [Candidatus Rokubacteria bacterium]
MGAVVSSSADVARLFAFLLNEPREHIYSLHVSGSNEVVGVELVGMGGMTEATCGVGDVFRSALLSGAAAIILIHNHPSGRATPSPSDRALTEELRGAGRLLRIPLLDHVVIARRGYFSFADHGLFESLRGAWQSAAERSTAQHRRAKQRFTWWEGGELCEG